MNSKLGSKRVLGHDAGGTSGDCGYLYKNRFAGIMRSKSLGL